MIDSAVLVQQKESGSLSPAQAKILDDVTDSGHARASSSPNRSTTLNNAQNPQLQQPTNNSEPDQQIQVDIDDTFDDLLDEDSLDEEMPRKKEESTGGKLVSKMSTPDSGASFDDMLDEDSHDVDTPHGDKLDSKMDTPGGDSFDAIFDEDSDDNIEALFQTKNSQPTCDTHNLFSPSQGTTILDKDDLADLGDEDDDDF